MPSTADLHDKYMDDDSLRLTVVAPGLRPFGGIPSYMGPVATVHGPAGEVKLKDILSEPGAGRVLVVDAGGCAAWALVGDMLAKLALQNGWSGIVLHGYVRDVAALRNIPFGIQALGSVPSRPRWDKPFNVERDVAVTFSGVTFEPGQWLYADEDGILVADAELTA